MPILENGLFALGQVLRFPVMALLWVCVAAALFMAGSCVVDFVARRRERRGFDVTAWLKSRPGAVEAPDGAAARAAGRRCARCSRDVEEARAQGALGDGGLEHLVLEREERVRRPLNAARMLVQGRAEPRPARHADPDGLVAGVAGRRATSKRWPARWSSRSRRTIIGLATGTLAYVVAAVRQSWVNETVREQRYPAREQRRAGETATQRRR